MAVGFFALNWLYLEVCLQSFHGQSFLIQTFLGVGVKQEQKLQAGFAISSQKP